MTINGVRARMLGVAVAAASLGAGAGVIANAGAHSGTTARAAHGEGDGGGHYGRSGRGRELGGRAVEGSAVVYYKGSYVTVSFNRGTVVSTSGNTLVIDEKVPGASTSYNASKSITVPSGATV